MILAQLGPVTKLGKRNKSFDTDVISAYYDISSGK